ncbi:hypothetical protein DERF_000042 [Dermatophagoides farinae]|uniref:Uncharacterized protein n=1 Tax=Dermatophagoides farinae TaxID=6954 RepID=A0A922LC80_DERFA|nr:hypothetical protein DERF_000042 [Dermatophagoides farinae]
MRSSTSYTMEQSSSSSSWPNEFFVFLKEGKIKELFFYYRLYSVRIRILFYLLLYSHCDAKCQMKLKFKREERKKN